MIHSSPQCRAACDLRPALSLRGRPSRLLRRAAALNRCFDGILSEQRNSRYQGISPVNSLLNCLALYAHSPHHRELEPNLSAQRAWAFYDEREGLRFAGARSQTWDTAFAPPGAVRHGTPPASEQRWPPRLP